MEIAHFVVNMACHW